jgi:hypothetical protein
MCGTKSRYSGGGAGGICIAMSFTRLEGKALLEAMICLICCGSSKAVEFFDVLLTVHLSIFILVVNQLDAQTLFYSKFISCLYMFRAPCAHRQEVKIVLYSLWYHHTYR